MSAATRIALALLLVSTTAASNTISNNTTPWLDAAAADELPSCRAAEGRPRCGPYIAGQPKCAGKACCSWDGYCGLGSRYCGSGCRPEYGFCSNPPAPKASPSPSPRPVAPSPAAVSPAQPSPAPLPAGGVSAVNVTFAKTDDWTTGYNGAITIQNSGSAAIADWRLNCTFDDVFTWIDGADVSRGANGQVTLAPKEWKRSIPAGGKIQISFGSNKGVPSSFVFWGAEAASPSPIAPAAPSTPAPKPAASPTPTTPTPAGPQQPGTALGTARATYHYYAPGYQVSTLYCTDAFAGKPAEWLHQYGWTAYCMSSVPMSQAMCGQCVRVTNPRTQATAVLRIVDQCGNGALDLDWDGSFKKIDTDGQGYADGHMNLEVQLVAC